MRREGGRSSDYRYDILDDSAHEGFIVNNSVIANSFIRRVVRAQIEIGAALNITTPSYLQDILDHLVALPHASVDLPWDNSGRSEHVNVWLNESPGLHLIKEKHGTFQLSHACQATKDGSTRFIAGT